jgi:hypothetical protein
VGTAPGSADSVPCGAAACAGRARFARERTRLGRWRAARSRRVLAVSLTCRRRRPSYWIAPPRPGSLVSVGWAASSGRSAGRGLWVTMLR